MRYIPSPITFAYSYMYSAMANKSGRMQYYRIKRNGTEKTRISRTEFIHAFNNYKIIAMCPVQMKDVTSVFQIEFYI